MNYIVIPAVQEKLKRAEEKFYPVVMMGPTGFGKSSAAEYYYRRKNPLVIYCKDGRLEDMPVISSIRQNVVIIEDAQWLDDDESIDYVIKLIKTPGRQIVIITRGAFPKTLTSLEMNYEFVRITEKDFRFGLDEVKSFFEDRNIELSEEELKGVTEASYGYPWALLYYARRIEDGEKFSADMQSAVWHDLFSLWDGSVYGQFGERLRELALELCQYDEFTIDMAEFITGRQKLGEVLEYCRNTTSQLVYNSHGSYSFRPEQRAFYMWKQKQVWNEYKITENLRKGGYYYESKDNIPQALRYYHKAHLIDNIKELLIKNANRHPGAGHYIEAREYYFELPEEDIKDSPVLMAGMSMLCNLIMDTDRSEYWYNELAEYEKDSGNPKNLRKEARIRLAYLDIALPSRGVKGLIKILKNVFSMMRKGDIVLPEMNATGSCPSLFNGGLDFSEWSKNDTQIAKFIAKPVEMILGNYGKGLATLALAESGFEKGMMDPYEVMTRCNNGYEAASHGGKIEVCFAATGIQVRQHIIQGQLPSARRCYESFRDKAVNEGAVGLMQNLDAFHARLDLYGNREYIQEYIKNAPDEKIFFCVRDRYRSMVKLRCLIAGNRLQEAFELSEFLKGFLDKYNRYINSMENELLRGVIRYRMGDEHWKENVISAVKRAAEYHFIRIISIEGIAVMQLLKELESEGALKDIPEDYCRQLIEETERVALAFPDYMRFVEEKKISLTRRENQILAMMCAGMTTDEICEECGFGYSALKKHNRNIYKKLGAKDRTEAERKALQLGLVNR